RESPLPLRMVAAHGDDLPFGRAHDLAQRRAGLRRRQDPRTAVRARSGIQARGLMGPRAEKTGTKKIGGRVELPCFSVAEERPCPTRRDDPGPLNWPPGQARQPPCGRAGGCLDSARDADPACAARGGVRKKTGARSELPCPLRCRASSFLTSIDRKSTR